MNSISSGIESSAGIHKTDRAERVLLERSRAGDERSFETLVTAHSARVLSLAYRLVGSREEAEDIAQEAFLRLHRGLKTFRGDSSVGTWLYSTVSRLAIDHLRREKLRRKIFFFRRSEVEQDPVETAIDPRRGQGENLLGGETARRLSRALGRLSARQRTVFVLRHQEEIPLKEIAQMLDLEVGTVKAHLHRAVTCLRQELSDLKED